MGWPVPTSGEGGAWIRGRVGGSRGRRRFGRRKAWRRAGINPFSDTYWRPYTVWGDPVAGSSTETGVSGGKIEQELIDGVGTCYRAFSFGGGQDASAWSSTEIGGDAGPSMFRRRLLRIQGSIYIRWMPPGYNNATYWDTENNRFNTTGAVDDGILTNSWEDIQPQEVQYTLLYWWHVARSSGGTTMVLDQDQDPARLAPSILARSDVMKFGQIPVTLRFVGNRVMAWDGSAYVTHGTPLGWSATTRLPIPRLPKLGIKLDRDRFLQCHVALARVTPYNAFTNSVGTEASQPHTGEGRDPVGAIQPHLRMLLAR